jgi:hypothetical protein
MPAKAGIQSTNLDSVFTGMTRPVSERTSPQRRSSAMRHQLGNQHTAAISLNSLRSFSHEAPRSSLR